MHYLGVEQPDGTEATEVHACAAFPAGIPEEIVLGDDLHLDPVGGEEPDELGEPITFERDTSVSDEVLFERRFG